MSLPLVCKSLVITVQKMSYDQPKNAKRYRLSCIAPYPCFAKKISPIVSFYILFVHIHFRTIYWHSNLLLLWHAMCDSSGSMCNVFFPCSLSPSFATRRILECCQHSRSVELYSVCRCAWQRWSTTATSNSALPRYRASLVVWKPALAKDGAMGHKPHLTLPYVLSIVINVLP